MKKFLAAAVMLCAVLTGCKNNSSMSLTFNVETGDSIKVKLDTSDDDYKLEANGSHFIVKEDGENVIEGIFLTEDMYAEYEEIIWETGTILEYDDYLFYEYDGEAGTERNILLMVPDSDTGVIMASLEDEDDVREAFSKLSFENE